MFDSLDDQMKADDRAEGPQWQKYLRWAAAGVLTLLVLGGLFLGVRMLEG